MAKRFLRQDTNRFSRLGKNKKYLQKWRRPKGRHSKMRKNRAGYPVSPIIGYKGPRKEAGKIKGLIPILVKNLNDIKKAGKDSILIIARVGAKKKIDLIKKAQELNIKIANIGGKK